MNTLTWLLACVPIFSFGFLPVVATRIGGRPVDQTMGTALGSLVARRLGIGRRKDLWLLRPGADHHR